MELGGRLRAGCDLQRPDDRLPPTREPDTAVRHPAPYGFGGFSFFHRAARVRVWQCESIMILII